MKTCSTVQVPSITELSSIHRKIIDLCDVPRRLSEILQALGVSSRGYFKERHLNPLIKAGNYRNDQPRQTKGIKSKIRDYGIGNSTKGTSIVESR